MIVYFHHLQEHRAMKILTIFLLVLMFGCATGKPTQPPIVPVITMTEINPDKWTAITRQNLEHLLQVYHLSPILFTLNIQIQSRVVPHSHPVLRLSTRYAERPNKLLSALIHEQLYWWRDLKKKEFNGASKELEKIIPLGKPSNYQLFIICFLEYKILTYYVGIKESKKILREFIQRDKVHPWINSQVYLKYKKIDPIIKKYRLSPIPNI